MTSDRTYQPYPAEAIPDWLPLSEEQRRQAWVLGQSAGELRPEDRAALALLIRPVAPPL